MSDSTGHVIGFHPLGNHLIPISKGETLYPEDTTSTQGDDCKVINRKIVNIKPPGIILTLAILSLEVPSIQLITSKRNVRKLCD